MTLDILHADGALVRRYSSNDFTPPPQDGGQVPAYWIRPLGAPPKVYEWTKELGDDRAELRSAAAGLLRSLQAGDAAPSSQLAAAVAEMEARIAAPRKNP